MYSSNSYSKFIKYSNLNEVSKFANFNNFFLLSNVSQIKVWFSINLSQEKSRLVFYSKTLLGSLLVYLVTGKYPNISSSKNRHIFYIESTLRSKDLVSFIEKFLIINNSKQRKNIIKTLKIQGNFVRFLVTDFNFFSELRSSIFIFSLVNWLYIDIFCNHSEKYRNILFLDNLFKSSYLI